MCTLQHVIEKGELGGRGWIGLLILKGLKHKISSANKQHLWLHRIQPRCYAGWDGDRVRGVAAEGPITG
jgi:hypothetical protein